LCLPEQLETKLSGYISFSLLRASAKPLFLRKLVQKLAKGQPQSPLIKAIIWASAQFGVWPLRRMGTPCNAYRWSPAFTGARPNFRLALLFSPQNWMQWLVKHFWSEEQRVW